MSDPPFPFYALLPDSQYGKVLAFVEGDEWKLPFFEISSDQGVGILDVGPVTRFIRDRLGVRVTTFHSMHGYDPVTERFTGTYVFTMENHDPDWQLPSNARWAGRDDIERFPDAMQRSMLETWFDEAEQVEKLV